LRVPSGGKAWKIFVVPDQTTYAVVVNMSPDRWARKVSQLHGLTIRGFASEDAAQGFVTALHERIKGQADMTSAAYGDWPKAGTV
jgi:hypothetical protein